MKNLILKSILSLCLASSACLAHLGAQDIIIKTNGETINCFVEEIGQQEIRYKRSDDSNGPVYTIETREVNKIVYENGRVEEFGRADEAPSTEEKKVEPGERVSEQKEKPINPKQYDAPQPNADEKTTSDDIYVQPKENIKEPANPEQDEAPHPNAEDKTTADDIYAQPKETVKKPSVEPDHENNAIPKKPTKNRISLGYFAGTGELSWKGFKAQCERMLGRRFGIGLIGWWANFDGTDIAGERKAQKVRVIGPGVQLYLNPEDKFKLFSGLEILVGNDLVGVVPIGFRYNFLRHAHLYGSLSIGASRKLNNIAIAEGGFGFNF